MARTRKALSDLHAPYIQSLVQLMASQDKATLVRWAVGYAGQVMLPLWSSSCPDDGRPRKALQAAHMWLAGKIKFPRARTAILACHAAAREAAGNPVAQAAARAIGHSAAAIHSARHALGLVLYGALAVAYHRRGADAPWEEIERCAAEECGRMEAALRRLAAENEPPPAHIDGKA